MYETQNEIEHIKTYLKLGFNKFIIAKKNPITLKTNLNFSYSSLYLNLKQNKNEISTFCHFKSCQIIFFF